MPCGPAIEPRNSPLGENTSADWPVATYTRPSASTAEPSPPWPPRSLPKSRWFFSEPSACTSNATSTPPFVTYNTFSSGLRMMPFAAGTSPYFVNTPCGFA